MGHRQKQLHIPGFPAYKNHPPNKPFPPPNLKGLTAKELDQQLAIATKTKSKGLKAKVLAEYKRRGIKPPTKQ